MIRPDFQPQRLAGESRAHYVKRRAAVNHAIKLRLKGRLAFVSSRPIMLPDPHALIDLQSALPFAERAKRWLKGEPRKVEYYKDTEEGRRVDADILAGRIRDVKVSKLLPYGFTRIGRTKGESMRYDDRPAVRAAALKARREARDAA